LLPLGGDASRAGASALAPAPAPGGAGENARRAEDWRVSVVAALARKADEHVCLKYSAMGL
jgi:hypothetical protein